MEDQLDARHRRAHGVRVTQVTLQQLDGTAQVREAAGHEAFGHSALLPQVLRLETSARSS